MGGLLAMGLPRLVLKYTKNAIPRDLLYYFEVIRKVCCLSCLHLKWDHFIKEIGQNYVSVLLTQWSHCNGSFDNP